MEETEELRSVTSFKAGGEYFAFDTSAIHHILEVVEPTRVPLTKPYVLGIINNHGNMIPVMDMRILLGKEPDDTLPEQCIVVVGVETDSKEEMLGFKVDEMDDVFSYAPEDFKPETVIETQPIIQRATAGTIKKGDKFVYLLKVAELAKGLE